MKQSKLVLTEMLALKIIMYAITIDRPAVKSIKITLVSYMFF